MNIKSRQMNFPFPFLSHSKPSHLLSKTTNNLYKVQILNYYTNQFSI